MDAEAQVSDVPDGDPLTRMLVAHRTFLENIYSLVRFLEGEVTKRGWELVKNGGYGISRNGAGRALSNFASADWFMTEAGVAFVPQGKVKLHRGATHTDIPDTGLDMLAFQVRWLDKSPSEPVVWRAKLSVTRLGPQKDTKWEDYQNWAFNSLEPFDETKQGTIKPMTLWWKKDVEGVQIEGTYVAIPVDQIRNEKDVVHLLVEPAVGDKLAMTADLTEDAISPISVTPTPLSTA